MAGFSGIDDLINEMTTNGKKYILPWQRVINTGATSVAGRWHEAFAGIGTGGQGVLTGTPGSGGAFSAASVGALPLNAAVTPDLRHLIGGHIFTSGATVVPGVAMLIDLLYMYPSCVVTGAATALAQTAAKPARMTANYNGIVAGCVVATALGAAQPLLTISYTDESGNAGSAATFAASANSQPLGSLLTGGSAAGVLAGPFARWAAGDTGIQQIDSYAITSGGTTGTATFILYRPLAIFPIPALGIAGERDFLNQMPTLPAIDDDACLAWLVQPGGAMTANQIISGELTMAWG